MRVRLEDNADMLVNIYITHNVLGFQLFSSGSVLKIIPCFSKSDTLLVMVIGTLVSNYSYHVLYQNKNGEFI